MDFLANEWAKDHHLRRRRDAKVARARSMVRAAGEFDALRQEMQRELADVEVAYRKACGQADDAEQSLVELKSAIEITESSARELSERVAQWERDEDGSSDDRSRLAYIRRGSEIRRRLGDACRSLDRLREQKPLQEMRAKRMKHDLLRWQSEYRERDNDVAAIAKRIHELRRTIREEELTGREQHAH